MTKIEKEKIHVDSLVRLGFGVTLFRDTILELIGIFIFISIFVSPIIYGYTTGKGYDSSIHVMSYLEDRSLGNLGYAQ